MKKIQAFLKSHGIGIVIGASITAGGFFAFFNHSASGTKAGAGIGKDTLIQVNHPADSIKGK